MTRDEDTFTHEEPGRYSPRRAIRRMRATAGHTTTTPTRSLVICTNPRTGSWAMSTALARTGRAGYPSEFFIPWDEADWSRLWDAGDIDGFFAGMLREGTSANGVFAIKVMWGHVPHIRERLATRNRPVPSDADLFPAMMPAPVYVWLSRRDTLRQAVSHALALRTGAWAAGVDESPGNVTAAADDVDTGLVFALQRENDEYERQWEKFFAAASVTPLRVWYEDLLADLPGQVRRVLEFVGVDGHDVDVPVPDVRRQSGALNERWVRECLAVARGDSSGGAGA